MTSTFTPNISLEEPANNDYVDTWNIPVNANMTAIDLAVGGHSTINVVAATGTVALTLAQYKPRTIILSGLLTADVIYQFPSGVGGFWMVVNSTTGAHSVTFSSFGAGASVVVSQGYNTVITCDATNVRLGQTAPVAAAGSNTQVQYNSSGFPAGSSNLVFDGTKLTVGALRVANALSGPLVTNGSGDVAVSTNIPLKSAANTYADVQTVAVALGANGTPLLVQNTSARIDGASIAIQLKPTATNAPAYVGAFDQNSDSDTGLKFLSSGGIAMYLFANLSMRLPGYGSGTLTTDGSGNVTASSDAKLKNILGQFRRGLADMKRMGSPVLHEWKREREEQMATGRPVGIYAGWTAQDVRVGIPEAVGLGPDGYLTLNDRAIIAVQHNAILELSARLERLESGQNLTVT